MFPHRENPSIFVKEVLTKPVQSPSGVQRRFTGEREARVSRKECTKQLLRCPIVFSLCFIWLSEGCLGFQKHKGWEAFLKT